MRFNAGGPRPNGSTLWIDALSRYRARTPELTPEVSARIQALADYVVSRLEADGVVHARRTTPDANCPGPVGLYWPDYLHRASRQRERHSRWACPDAHP